MRANVIHENDVAVVENKWLCMLLAKVESSDTTSKKQKQKTTQNKDKEQHKKQQLKNMFFFVKIHSWSAPLLNVG